MALALAQLAYDEIVERSAEQLHIMMIGSAHH
jgi:hypothetical protein